MVSSDEDGGDISPQIVPFPVSARPSRPRRSRLARPPTPPSACEESAHYPVFNPEDPRHNPALGRNGGLDPVESLPQTAQSVGSIRWMHGLPGRSLRRARSGLQALRSGLHRRPSRSADESHVTNGLWSSSDSAEGSSDPRERFFSSTVSEASTEEDYEFGTGLYRTGCNCPGPKKDEGKDTSLPSVPHTNLDPLPRLSSGADMPLIFPMDTIASASPDEDLSSAEKSLITEDSPTVEKWQTTEKYPTVEKWPTTEMVPTTAKSLTTERSSITERSPTTEGFPIAEESPTTERLPAAEDQPTYTNSRFPRPGDAPVAVFDDKSPAPSVDHQTSIQDLSTWKYPVPGSSSTAASPGESQLDPSADFKEAHAPVEATGISCLSRTSSLLRPSQAEQVPCGETEVTVTTKEICSTNIRESESHKAEAVDEQTQSTSAARKTSFNLDHALPEVELSGLASMEYYLSLNTMGASEESKTSDEEPSPDSLIGDRHAPLSPWLPTDKGDRTSLLSLQDEYFLVDGKSTDLRPDRGDNPIKGERGFAGDGGLHSGPGLDRNLSVRTQEIPEIIGPGGPMGAPRPRSFPRDREGSDSTEEYLVTYSLLHRHYFS
ncbi:uncharacterized protein BDV17DRAFT_266251 [Aspergillus undulatus]|uniref:uncharacterized protein n=1 Tax=Aspergillus undulatus TaxID=1810928 RepID=UPI003CCD22B1